jgi:DNA polymerase-3 subunit delta'
MSIPFPWLSASWRELLSRARAGNLPHALLFTGASGYGKTALALALARSLLCQSPQSAGEACGVCQACGLLNAGTHPDLMPVMPEEEGKAIPIDRIRMVASFLSLKGQYGGRQVVVINPADAMNRYAANSLLKTLEEPTEDALLILVTSRPSLLLPTIRSRCQQLMFTCSQTGLAEDWLHAQIGQSVEEIQTLLTLAGGAPLEALHLHESGGLARRRTLAAEWLQLGQGRDDPLKCAADWSELDLSQAIQWLASWTMDLIRLKSGGDGVAIKNSDLRPQLQSFANTCDLRELFAFLEQITEYTRRASGQLNVQLALEDLMISWNRRHR